MVSQKHRPRRRPQIADLENTDLENAGLEDADLENANLENTDLENAACLLIEKLRPFIKSMGERKFQRAQNYHQDGPSLLIN